MASDVTFFTQYHKDLLHVLAALLAEDGAAIFFAPRRRGTLDAFLARARATAFTVVVEEEFDAEVSAARKRVCEDTAFEPDLHAPLLVTLRPQSAEFSDARASSGAGAILKDSSSSSK